MWRGGTAQARLATFLKSVTVHRLDDGQALGLLLALTGIRNVVDADTSAAAHVIVTGNPAALRGSIAAAEASSHIGARPLTPLTESNSAPLATEVG